MELKEFLIADLHYWVHNMPITRKLISQDAAEDNQILKMDSLKRYIVNDTAIWQFLFSPNSDFTASEHIIKIAAEFDTEDLDSVRFTAYLYNPNSGAIASGATCSFSVFKVSSPGWSDVPVTTFSGTLLGNSYFYADLSLSSLLPFDLDGSQTMMIEATITRLSYAFRDRIYINHLGIYDSFLRLKQDVEFLDITKLDE